VQWFERIGGALLLAAALYFLDQALTYTGGDRAHGGPPTARLTFARAAISTEFGPRTARCTGSC
jgi:hypothetical protein